MLFFLRGYAFGAVGSHKAQDHWQIVQGEVERILQLSKSPEAMLHILCLT